MLIDSSLVESFRWNINCSAIINAGNSTLTHTHTEREDGDESDDAAQSDNATDWGYQLG